MGIYDWNSDYKNMGISEQSFGGYNPQEKAGIFNSDLSNSGLAASGNKGFDINSLWNNDKGNFDFGTAMGNFGTAYGIYDGLMGSGAVQRDMQKAGLAGLNTNINLANRTMENNVQSYNNTQNRNRAIHNNANTNGQAYAQDNLREHKYTERKV